MLLIVIVLLLISCVNCQQKNLIPGTAIFDDGSLVQNAGFEDRVGAFGNGINFRSSSRDSGEQINDKFDCILFKNCKKGYEAKWTSRDKCVCRRTNKCNH
uniref:Uncharacterized protein n=1 Tax=Rhabditophanes sp. KR3021 TaxID=114890 RepID=A0AC35TV41_9BILA